MFKIDKEISNPGSYNGSTDDSELLDGSSILSPGTVLNLQ